MKTSSNAAAVDSLTFYMTQKIKTLPPYYSEISTATK